MSSFATAEYYRLLNAGVRERLGGHSAADVVIYSVDFAVMEQFIRDQAWEAAARHLVDRALKVQAAGAEFLVLATNTFHRVADRIEVSLSIPFVHIVDVTADAALADGVSTVGLLGTSPVMEAPFYRERFARSGVDVLVPAPSDRALVHRVIFEELTHGVIDPGSRREYLRIMQGLVARGAQGIVLGCTEISLLVGPGDTQGIRLYDTTALHVKRAVSLALTQPSAATQPS